jgi:hypothetical protein
VRRRMALRSAEASTAAERRTTIPRREMRGDIAAELSVTYQRCPVGTIETGGESGWGP